MTIGDEGNCVQLGFDKRSSEMEDSPPQRKMSALLGNCEALVAYLQHATCGRCTCKQHIDHMHSE